MERARTRSYPKLLPTLLLTVAAQLPARDAAGQQRYAGLRLPDAAPVPGQVVGALPREASRLTTGGDTVYYHDGVFLRPAGEGYAVIRAPLGLSVPALPAAAARVSCGEREYWYDRGTFYARAGDGPGYVTVFAPPGAVVPTLPTDVSAIADIGGVLYYLYAGAFYRPILHEGRTAYLVTDP